MSLKALTANTAPEENAHILAEDDAAIFQSMFGEDGVLEIGQQMKATVISNNKVRVADGFVCIGGHIARTVYGDYTDLTIENGESGKNRNDLIIGTFSTTGAGGIDTMQLTVKKGAAGTAATDPALTQGNLYTGSKLREVPLWRVKIEGLSITKVEQLFEIVPSIPTLKKELESLNGKLVDSGWITCGMGNGLSAAEGQAPSVRKIGNVVYLRGSVTNGTTWSEHDAFLTIPSGYRPPISARFIQWGYGTYRYTLSVEPTGTCVANHITNDQNGDLKIPSGSTLRINCSWLVN